jgi:hypothetical protein
VGRKISTNATSCPAGIGFKKTLRIDPEIAHFDLPTMPKKKMRHYEDLPSKIETIPHSHGHDKGAVCVPHALPVSRVP